MKMKIRAILLIILSCTFLFAQEADFHSFMAGLLENNPDYMRALSRFEQEKALLRIDRSLNLFDVNFSYQKYNNDILRDETRTGTFGATSLELTDIAEKDERWRVELNKQLFPKDFDAAADAIGFRLDLLRFEQEMILARYNCISDIFDDMILWFKAVRMIELLQERLEILYQQNTVLEELDLENIIEPETMILLLEEIDDKEDEMYDYLEITSLMNSKYGDVIEVFYSNFQLFILQNEQPDTLMFSRNIADKINKINLNIRGISHKIKWNYYKVYLPEVNLTLSYNWRKTNQDWDITKNGVYENLLRKQNEEFPEGEIEFSIPFNIFSNTSGKLALLKSFERELHYRSHELILDWQTFKFERTNFYQEAELELKRKTRLLELYERQLNLQKTKYREEPSLLGSNPELKLQKETLKTVEAEMKKKLAEMKLYREIFLINSFGEEAK